MAPYLSNLLGWCDSREAGPVLVLWIFLTPLCLLDFSKRKIVMEGQGARLLGDIEEETLESVSVF